MKTSINAYSTATGYENKYLKTAEAEKSKKAAPREPMGIEAYKAIDIADSNKQEVFKVKKLYEEEQEKSKRRDSDRKRQAEEERKAEEIRELTEKLNRSMNTFSQNIKFGINDKVDSIAISFIEKNGVKKIKDLSKDEADMLLRRIDYAIGVLFDKKV